MLRLPISSRVAAIAAGAAPVREHNAFTHALVLLQVLERRLLDGSFKSEENPFFIPDTYAPGRACVLMQKPGRQYGWLRFESAFKIRGRRCR